MDIDGEDIEEVFVEDAREELEDGFRIDFCVCSEVSASVTIRRRRLRAFWT